MLHSTVRGSAWDRPTVSAAQAAHTQFAVRFLVDSAFNLVASRPCHPPPRPRCRRRRRRALELKLLSSAR